MAALILDLYKRGFRNFIYFVNSTNIIEKTRDNFSNPASSKYLFTNNIMIDGKRVEIKDVENFSDGDSGAINIVFTTIQGPHTDLNIPRENRLSHTDFEDMKVVLIGDEAHHNNSKTLLDKEDLDRGSIQSSCYENQKATHGKYFLPFRHLIKCSVCGHYLIPARNRGHSGTYYLNYRCRNKACTRPKNNIRMHVIMDQLYEEFGRIGQKYDFTSFVDDMSEYANKKMQEFTVEKRELLGQKTQKQRKIDDLAEKYAELDKESPKAVKDKLKKGMADLQNDVVNIDERIKQIEAKIKNPEKLRMTIEKFSNSLNSLINRLEKGDLVEKDILVRNMVSNLEIDAQKRVIYRYKSPFNFIFEPEFSTGSPVGEPGGT